MCLFIIQFVLYVVCFIVLVNCLLNAFVICLGEIAVLLFKSMVFCVWVCILLPSLCMVCHSVYVYIYFVLFQIPFLKVWDHVYILCACSFSDCSCLKCSGDNLHVLCILSFGMCCLPACWLMLVSVVFAMCGRVSIFLFLKATLVYSVNCIQFAFLTLSVAQELAD